MIALHPDRLEWRDDHDSDSCRLYFDGRPSSVIKRQVGSIVRDTFPTDVIELKDEGIFEQALALELSGAIRTTGQNYIEYKTPEMLKNEALRAAGIGVDYKSPDSSSPAPTGVISGFKMPTVGPVKVSSKERKSAKKPTNSKTTQLSPKKLMIASALVVSIGSGGVFGYNALFNKDSTPVATANSLNIVGTTSSTLGSLDPSLAVAEIPTGWTKDATWKFKINSPSIAVSGFQNGIVLCDGKSVTILDPETGETLISVEGKGVPKLVSTAMISDTTKAIIWKIANVLYVWNPDLNQVQYYKLAADALVETNGTGALIRQNKEPFVLTESGLRKIQGASGKEISVDGNNVIISSGWNGPITLRSYEGEIVSESLIDPPKPGMIVNSWHGAGTGVALISWKTSKTNVKKDSEKVVLATHSTETGEVLGQVDTTIGLIKNKPARYGGADKQVTVGPYIFSLDGGKLLGNASKDASDFILILDNHAYGKKIGGGLLTYIDGKKQDRLTPNTPITILDDGSSVARVSPETIARLPKQ